KMSLLYWRSVLIRDAALLKPLNGDDWRLLVRLTPSIAVLSDSRFDEQLRRARLIPEGEDSILNLEVRDPCGNTADGFRPQTPRARQALTGMALSAGSGKSGTDLNGYRDYRGVPVVGTWLWDNELGMGLATEMDVAEAFGPYRRVRELVLFML